MIVVEMVVLMIHVDVPRDEGGEKITNAATCHRGCVGCGLSVGGVDTASVTVEVVGMVHVGESRLLARGVTDNDNRLVGVANVVGGKNRP